MDLLNFSFKVDHISYVTLFFYKIKGHIFIICLCYVLEQITNYLEQRCYKEMRNGQFGYVNTIMTIYRRLLFSCKEQMYVFTGINFHALYVCL